MNALVLMLLLADVTEQRSASGTLTNLVIATNYAGTVQVGTNFYRLTPVTEWKLREETPPKTRSAAMARPITFPPMPTLTLPRSRMAKPPTEQQLRQWEFYSRNRRNE